MKIETTLLGSGAIPVSGKDEIKAKKSEGAHPAATMEASPPYSVTLSNAVTLTDAALESDAARHERVAAIRAQLASGSYNISGKDVADKMLKALKG